jgi:transcriptional regulator with XRE-family HTH domain
MMKRAAPLSALEVKHIRERLGMTRLALAEELGMSEDAVKAWETDRTTCSGPPAILLRMLARNPGILSLAFDEAVLPPPDAIPGTEAWFRLQRLLFVIGENGMDLAYWEAVYVEEGFTEDWLAALEQRDLVTRSSRNPRIRRWTGVARQKFHLGLYTNFVRREGFEVTSDYPVWTSEALAAAFALQPRPQ